MKQLPLIGLWKFIWHVMDWLIIRWRPICHNGLQPWVRCILRDLYSLSHLCIFHPAAGFPAPRLSSSHSSWSRISGKHGCCSPSWRGNRRMKYVKCQFYVKHTHIHTHQIRLGKQSYKSWLTTILGLLAWGLGVSNAWITQHLIWLSGGIIKTFCLHLYSLGVD